MIGAIAGDIFGSIYEYDNIKSLNFDLYNPKCFFTDDTVLTVATADCLLNNARFEYYYKNYFFEYPDRGYGVKFFKWAYNKNPLPYYSWGNGSAMRVGPVGLAFTDLDSVLYNARESAIVTHNHPEGIKGAEAIAATVFLANSGKSKEEIRNYIVNSFGYDLTVSLDKIRDWYIYDVSCKGSVPVAIIAFLESTDFEDSIKKAISVGGDSDTIACITGSISGAFYKKISKKTKDFVYERLDQKMIGIVENFNKKYNVAHLNL